MEMIGNCGFSVRLKFICIIVDIFKGTMPMLYAKMPGGGVLYARQM